MAAGFSAKQVALAATSAMVLGVYAYLHSKTDDIPGDLRGIWNIITVFASAVLRRASLTPGRPSAMRPL